MPRYLVEREFPNGLQIPVDETGATCFTTRRADSCNARRRASPSSP